MQSWREISIPVPWGHISGKWWGSEGRRPILALHGWQDNAGTFDKLAPLLVAEGLSILAIDLPGHGQSSHLPKGQFYYLYWDGILLVRRIVRHFKWPTVTLLGHSLGGAISLMYAGAYPDGVDKLVSIDIAGPVTKPEKRTVADTAFICDKFLDYENLNEKRMPSYSRDDVMDLVMDAYKGSLTKESCEILMQRGTKEAAVPGGLNFCRDVRLKIAGLAPFSRELVIEFAKAIRCEILNIKGKPGMVFDNENFYHEVIEATRAGAKRLERHEVEGTHHLHLNDPQHMAPLVINFLSEFDPQDIPI
ncbi:probable serine hydrolase [Neocloeon triangulifer]|uniref:probable serine hydrolase n=1 Tax=Neocloeon triangulifer TaxID=2078957 RepID=UPI00286F4879|nr:probable serine hydrolase [Neocloeon triangulifer]